MLVLQCPTFRSWGNLSANMLASHRCVTIPHRCVGWSAQIQKLYLLNSGHLCFSTCKSLDVIPCAWPKNLVLISQFSLRLLVCKTFWTAHQNQMIPMHQYFGRRTQFWRASPMVWEKLLNGFSLCRDGHRPIWTVGFGKKKLWEYCLCGGVEWEFAFGKE